MLGANSLIVIGVLFLFLIIFWPWTLMRAISQIMSHAFFGPQRPLDNSEYRRFLLSCVLMMTTVALGFVLLAPSGLHPHPEYLQPVGFLRLMMVSTGLGLLIGAGFWAFFSLKMKRVAKFHHPDIATWKGIGFGGPKKRKMTPQERSIFLQRMNVSDYLQATGLAILYSASVPAIVIALSLLIDAPSKGFLPVLRHLAHFVIDIEGLLILIGLVSGTFFWLAARLFVWLGWTRTYA